MKYVVIIFLFVLVSSNIVIFLLYRRKGEKLFFLGDKTLYFPFALWITNKIDFSKKKYNGVLNSIKKINVCEKESDCLKNIINKKVSQIILVVIILSLLLILFLFEGVNENEDVFLESINRPEYGENNKNVNVTVEVDGKEEQDMKLEIKPNILSENEANELIDNAKKYIDNNLLGSNESINNISNSICLISSYPNDSNIDIIWNIQDDGFIDYDGNIVYEEVYKRYKESGFNDDIDLTTTLTVEINYFEYSREYEITVGTTINNLVQNNIISDYITRDINSQNDSYSDSGAVSLPKTIANHEIKYKNNKTEEKENIYFIILLGIIFIFVIIISTKIDIEENIKKRNKQLIIDFPIVVNKFALLLGAGMTVKKAWIKMCENYQEKRKNGYKKRYIYEEMAYTLNAITNGESEVNAYNGFGKRIGVNSYLKLSSILVQSLQKGNEHVVDDLQIEASQKIREHTEIVKQCGEKLDTKLVLPTIGLLIITLSIVVLPLFFSM